jgi:ABC-type multidrug transport system fused ATPase/permease subunit
LSETIIAIFLGAVVGVVATVISTILRGLIFDKIFGDTMSNMLSFITFILVFYFFIFTTFGQTILYKVNIFDKSDTWNISARKVVWGQCMFSRISPLYYDSLKGDVNRLTELDIQVAECCALKIFKNISQDDYLSLNDNVAGFKVKNASEECQEKSIRKVNKLLEDANKKENTQKFPHMVHKDIMMNNRWVENNIMYYSYTLLSYDSNTKGLGQNYLNQVKQVSHRGACKTSKNKNLMSQGAQFDFLFFDKNNKPIGNVMVSTKSCSQL